MVQRVLKTVSFGPLDLNLLDWADSRGSFSRYVKRLIAQDVRTDLPPLNPQLVRLIDRLVEAHVVRLMAQSSTPSMPPGNAPDVAANAIHR